MAQTERTQLVRDSYEAYATSNRDRIEELLADDLEFFSPPDPGIDRAGYFERCWPNSGHAEKFDIVRMIESGDEIVCTYEAARTDGTRFRNTEAFTFRGSEITRIEVYFGWDLD